MSSNGPVISLKDVSFRYGGHVVLEDINLDVFQDDFLGLVGPNGGGKTTLLKVILGLLEPDSGAVTVLGEAPKVSRAALGYVPQYTQFDTRFPITVREIVLMGRLGHSRLGARYGRKDVEAAQRAMDELSIADLAGKTIGELSGGQRQRTLVARALACEPRALIMDEPTSSVDSRVELSFYELLRKLHSKIPIILVSHDLGVVSAHVTRVACLNRRLVVNSVADMQPSDFEALYDGPIRFWAHKCEL